MPTEHSFYANHLVDALREEGIPSAQIWELSGWKVNEQGYYWTNIFTNQHNGYNGVANGHLNHHTASSGYTPFVKNSKGQTKANGWVGMRRGDRLYQSGDGVPTIALTSAGPADYSAGSGVREYIKKLSRSEKAGKQTASDDDPKFYGNRYVWNTEIVCDGVGGQITQDSWDLLIVYNAALARLHDATQFWNGFHAGFTRRKIDFRDGRYASANATIEAMWPQIAAKLGTDPVEPPIEPPIEPPDPGDLVDTGRNQLYVKTGQTGQDVEYWQNIIIQVVEGVLDTGNSTKSFFDANAPASAGLTWRVWDDNMTAYFSAWTRRNSYGVGATERKMLDQAYIRLVNAN